MFIDSYDQVPYEDDDTFTNQVMRSILCETVCQCPMFFHYKI